VEGKEVGVRLGLVALVDRGEVVPLKSVVDGCEGIQGSDEVMVAVVPSVHWDAT
jgi:hypothetical protein